MNTAIIGAGIGGLTTALTLQQRNINVAIYEGAPAIKPVGAGIIMANNAMQVFQQLGIQSAIEKAGNKISRLRITDPQLHDLSVIDLHPFEAKYGVHNVAIHRGALQQILADAVGYEHIHLSKRLSRIEKNDDFTLYFDDYTAIQTNVLIGADGIKSVVRNQLFEQSQLRNAHQYCWRGICEMNLHERHHNAPVEAWGKGKRFGFVKIGAKKVYWYALVNSLSFTTHGVNLVNVFGDFHRDILEIISNTPQQQLIETEIIDLKPITKWHGDRVCLVGDAAHATTPNMGQGACQAVEDAYILGKLLDKGLSLEKTFAEYQRLRQKKARMIVDTSWRMGQLSQLENDWGIWVRNALLKLVPSSINQKQMETVFRLATV